MLKDLDEKAMKQYQEEKANLMHTLERDPLLNKLAENILKLRNLKPINIIEAHDILCGLHTPSSVSFLFNIILDRDEYLTLPRYLDDLLERIEYNILDDGFMETIKIELVNSYNEKRTEFFIVQDLADAINYDGWLEIYNSITASDYAITNISSESFASVEDFISFIEVLNKDENYSTGKIKTEFIAGRFVP